ncbi:Uncharacterised protein [Legionella spiritensis]|nr:Uncharacterised protein [Legionella spiritensis]
MFINEEALNEFKTTLIVNQLTQSKMVIKTMHSELIMIIG